MSEKSDVTKSQEDEVASNFGKHIPTQEDFENDLLNDEWKTEGVEQSRLMILERMRGNKDLS